MNTDDMLMEEEIKSDIDNSEYINELLLDMLKVSIDVSNLEDCIIDKKEFTKGIKEVSKVAGMFTCLKNVGMDTESALTYILNESNIKHSQDMQKMINQNQIEVGKIVKVNEEGARI